MCNRVSTIAWLHHFLWTKHLDRKLDGNYTSMLRVVLNTSWKRYSTEHLYGHLLPNRQTIQVRWIKHADFSRRSKDELTKDIILWIPTHGHTSVDQPAKANTHQFSVDTGCRLEDLSRVTDDMDRESERGKEKVKGNRFVSMQWWRWCEDDVIKVKLIEDFLQIVIKRTFF